MPTPGPVSFAMQLPPDVGAVGQAVCSVMSGYTGRYVKYGVKEIRVVVEGVEVGKSRRDVIKTEVLGLVSAAGVNEGA